MSSCELCSCPISSGHSLCGACLESYWTRVTTTEPFDGRAKWGGDKSHETQAEGQGASTGRKETKQVQEATSEAEVAESKGKKR